MQAPLSSTASGKHLRTRRPPVLSTAMKRSIFDTQGTAAVDHGKVLSTYQADYEHLHRLPEQTGLAHDAGNLLGALTLYCDLLAQPDILREEHSHYAKELRLLSERIQALVGNLLRADSKQFGATSTKIAGCAVPHAIHVCHGLLNAVARQDIAVTCEAGSDCEITISTESLERVLVNLVKNAAEASVQINGDSAQGVSIRVNRIRADTGLDRLLLAVDDKGCGLSTEAIALLMANEPMNLLDSRSSGERGLGFQIVRELVDASGGEIQVESELGRGTTVVITWPVQRPVTDNIALTTLIRPSNDFKAIATGHLLFPTIAISRLKGRL
jgi:signal transduction histidine kinase